MRPSPFFFVLSATFATAAIAQMPVPLIDARPEAGEARRQLESLLACKPGTQIDPKTVEARFAALGLAKGQDGIFQPTRGARATAFGSEVVAALVFTSEGERKAALYLRGQKVDPLAKKLGANKVNEEANTDDRSYFKETSKTTTLLVGAASELLIGDSVVRYQSVVACQVN